MVLHWDVTVYGDALETRGFESHKTDDPIGLLTFGFVWPGPSIWGPGENVISTTWTACDPSITTTWSDGEPNVSTTWTDC